ncbi:hypothetical protein NQ317_010804 [Molorchus minor]|uniref:Uncharacterized protein n=1 Tax=Molorchus minor TaxID=1323400 RepID=A0ABQ9IWG8_9CUCU|nr:hypothetical protein NQ317_010804 [Molorchus minor]
MLETVVTSLTNTMGETLSLRDHTEREQAWLDLLSTNKLKHLKTDKLLEMALNSKCFRVAEYLYERQHDYSNIIPCYLKDPVRKTEVFNYILNYINVSERCIQEQFLVNFKELVAVSSKKTSEIVIEYFPDLIEQFSEMLEDNCDLQYVFLSEIVLGDVKLPPRIAEMKYEVHVATALLLEQGGEWTEAIELLLKHDMIEEGINLCIRGAEHLDSEGAQRLWLMLLQHKRETENYSLRQLLHAAAPHVPPAQLLELVSNVNFGDVRNLLQGILSDYTHDVQMLSTTLKLLGKDLHYGKYTVSMI